MAFWNNGKVSDQPLGSHLASRRWLPEAPEQLLLAVRVRGLPWSAGAQAVRW